MTTRLTIRWDGTAPGLAEHTLSLGAWLEPLALLLKAVRRAGGVAGAASLTDAQRRRLRKEASRLDLKMVALTPGSLNLALDCVAPPASRQQPLFLDALPARALGGVLDAIEASERGEPGDVAVQRFLGALPMGVAVQEYGLESGGAVRKVVIAGKPAVAVTTASPRLLTVVGSVAGVRFGEGRWAVTIRGEGRVVTFPATAALVEAAVALRGAPVRVVAVVGASSRLVSLRAADAPAALGDPEVRAKHFVGAWARTLEILGR